MNEMEIIQMIYEGTAPLERRIKRLEQQNAREIRSMSSELTYWKRRVVNESVRFFELQPLSFQLLHQIQENPGLIAEDWLSAAADEINYENKLQFISNGVDLLKSFNEHRVFLKQD